MSTVSPKQQLIIARQQFDKLSIFIAGLADLFHGAGLAIEDEFQHIKKRLSRKPNSDKAPGLLASLTARLKEESKYMQQKNADTLSQIQKSLRQLTNPDAVDDGVTKEIKSFMQSSIPDEAKAAGSPVVNVEAALGLFKKALLNNMVVSDHKDKGEQQKLHLEITRKLKELIAPLYAKETSKWTANNNTSNNPDTAISEIHQKLNQGINAMTDTLTQLPYRTAYDEKTSAEFARSRRNKALAFMAIFDIDRFKQINDKYGLSVGDKPLQIVAVQLRKLLPKNGFLAPWGGEKFVALLFDDNIGLSFNKLEYVRTKIAKLPIMFKGQRVSLAVIIRLAEFSS